MPRENILEPKNRNYAGVSLILKPGILSWLIWRLELRRKMIKKMFNLVKEQYLAKNFENLPTEENFCWLKTSDSYGLNYYAMDIKESEIGPKYYVQRVISREKYLPAFTLIWYPEGNYFEKIEYDNFESIKIKIELNFECEPNHLAHLAIFLDNLQKYYYFQAY